MAGAKAPAERKVKGAWYPKGLPQHIVIEQEDGTLGMFNHTPFRKITEMYITKYVGHHLSKGESPALPDYLYRFYGLER